MHHTYSCSHCFVGTIDIDILPVNLNVPIKPPVENITGIPNKIFIKVDFGPIFSYQGMDFAWFYL